MAPDNGIDGSDKLDESGDWRERLGAFRGGLSADEVEALAAESLSALDRAARVRPIATAELARLSALAGYLTPRIERRANGLPVETNDVMLMGLIAGYQLATGEQTPGEPDPFADA
jgi:hypothetical protein